MKLYYQFPGTWFGDCMPFGKGDEFFLFRQRDNRNPEPFGEPFGWDLATTKDVYLVSLDDEHIESLCATSDYYTKNVIPADVYGTDGDVTTVAVGAVILARDDVSEDAIYNFTKDLFDNAASEVSSHAKYGELNLDFAASVTSVPYHPGAAKYFAEKGYTVATK